MNPVVIAGLISGVIGAGVASLFWIPQVDAAKADTRTARVELKRMADSVETQNNALIELQAQLAEQRAKAKEAAAKARAEVSGYKAQAERASARQIRPGATECEAIMEILAEGV